MTQRTECCRSINGEYSYKYCDFSKFRLQPACIAPITMFSSVDLKPTSSQMTISGWGWSSGSLPFSCRKRVQFPHEQSHVASWTKPVRSTVCWRWSSIVTKQALFMFTVICLQKCGAALTMRKYYHGNRCERLKLCVRKKTTPTFKWRFMEEKPLFAKKPEIIRY